MRIAAVFTILAAMSASALAGYPPIKYRASRAEIAAKCEALGANGLGVGLQSLSGDYSCKNLATGNLVECRADGLCTSYSGDPRVKRLNLKPARSVIA
jgi:hypothetical protein